MSTPNTPEAQMPDHWRDAKGRLVPDSLVKPIDKLRDQTVRKIVQQAIDLNAIIGKFKSVAFSDIASFCEISAEQFETHVGGEKGNVTLRTYDGEFKVERSIQEHIAFDERLQSAKALIDECITEWSAGSRPEIQVLVTDAFQVDQAGRVSTERVLGLRRLAITDGRWTEAMRAIAESVTVVGSKSYLRIYRRVGDTGRYEPISLDIAAV
ncbi:DUF3164 family protein [Ideonella sp.]|uniref:DUF3164 family protein n=1 Tax=Ideonella sp. TaxID=1929293 RepID=UPI003BB73050